MTLTDVKGLHLTAGELEEQNQHPTAPLEQNKEKGQTVHFTWRTNSPDEGKSFVPVRERSESNHRTD